MLFLSFPHQAEKPIRQNKPLACSHTIAEQTRASQQQMYTHSRSVRYVKSNMLMHQGGV